MGTEMALGCRVCWLVEGRGGSGGRHQGAEAYDDDDDTLVSAGFPHAKSRPLYGRWLQHKQWPACHVV